MNESLAYSLEEKIKNIVFEENPFISKEIFKLKFLSRKDLQELLNSELNDLKEAFEIVKSLEEFMEVKTELDNINNRRNIIANYMSKTNKYNYFIIKLNNKKRIEEILDYLDKNIKDSFNFYLKEYLDIYSVNDIEKENKIGEL